MSHRRKKPKPIGRKRSGPGDCSEARGISPLSGQDSAVRIEKPVEPFQVSFTMPVPFPGTRRNLIHCNQWKGNDPRNLAGPTGKPGNYMATFVLARVQQNMMTIEAAEADSFIRFPSDESNPHLDLPRIRRTDMGADGTVQLDGYVNATGRLSTLVISNLSAVKFSDAAAKAEAVANRFLSQLAVRFHVPLVTTRVEIREVSTSNLRVSLIMPFGDAVVAPFNLPYASTDTDLYLSLYREALNTTSVAYRFLCMYKIIEGIEARRARLGSAVKERRVNWSRREIIPPDLPQCATWLTELFDRKWSDEIVHEIIHPAARGKRFKHVINNKLSPIRVRIAHSVLDNGNRHCSPTIRRI